MTAPLLELEDVSRTFPSRDGRRAVTAVDGVSLRLEKGETIGIVGESGCGKSTLARLILRLIEPTAGVVRFEGEDLASLDRDALRRRRRDFQIVFQDPFASLDPRMKVGAIIAEPLEVHRIGGPVHRRARVAELLGLVGLKTDAAARYPHEFSGGQRQRIGIARAIALEPKLLVADEPVSALDVSVQSQILNLLVDLRERLMLSYVFISHDLGVVEYMSDRVAVMYLGRIVETAPVEGFFRRPLHPYAQALLAAVPVLDLERQRAAPIVVGDIPNPENPPTGCPFHPRCSSATEVCRRDLPKLRVSESSDETHLVACHLY